MEEVSLAEAQARLSAIIDRVEAGETVTITRRGRPVAKISAIDRPTKAIDLAELARLRDTLPPLAVSSAELIREMRDEGW